MRDGKIPIYFLIYICDFFGINQFNEWYCNKNSNYAILHSRTEVSRPRAKDEIREENKWQKPSISSMAQTGMQPFMI